MTRHLITGGSGFLGSALCEALVARGHEVTSLDNDSRNTRRVPGVKYVQADVRQSPTVYEAAQLFDGCDAVFHLAAVNGTSSFYSRPSEVLSVQIQGTDNVIAAAESSGVKTLVLFSSSEVYATPPFIPTPETVPLSIPDITNPRFSYAVGKIAAEAMCWHSAIERVIVIRPHQVYGANAGYDHVIPQFITRMARTPPGGTFDIYGANERSFIHIDDFTDAVVKIWEHHEKQEGRVREIYHVGTEDQVQITAVAGMIARMMGRHDPKAERYMVKFKTHEGPAGGTRVRCPDTRKLRSLGWGPKVSLEEGLQQTVEAYLEKMSEWPT